jgi:hypothetical protein
MLPKRREEALTMRNVVTVVILALVGIAASMDAGSRSKPTVQAPVLGNYPDTSLPLSTNTTVTPDAAPIDTTRITVSTSTNFKGIFEGYPATGVIRVTDAHPAGIYTVTVTAFDSDGVSASKTFIVTVTTPATCDPVSFAPATSNIVDQGAGSTAVGDFNCDGNQDLAVGLNGSVSILLGNGDGTFQAVATYTVGSDPASLAIGDFNGDGHQDLAVTNYGSNNVSILLGNGDGTFQPVVNYLVGMYPRSVAVGDFNGDGNQDLAVVNEGSINVSILFGDGAGHFSAATNLFVNGTPRSIAVGDFNNDGNQDLAVTAIDYPLNWVLILLGNGDGTFHAVVNYIGYGATSVVVGDFNGDGNQDLALATYGPPPNYPGSVSILLGDGDGTFSPLINFGTANPTSIAVGDFNGDGNQDLAVTNYDDPFKNGSVSIFSGHGDGTFGPQPISAPAKALARSWSAISMVMATKISPLPTLTTTIHPMCRSCCATAH